MLLDTAGEQNLSKLLRYRRQRNVIPGFGMRQPVHFKTWLSGDGLVEPVLAKNHQFPLPQGP